MQPDIRYTDRDPQIAYQVLGGGDLDLVFAFDWASNVELIWQHPSVERFLRRLASFSRLVVFDTRGMGCPIRHGWGHGVSLATLASDIAGEEQTLRWWASVERAAGRRGGPGASRN